MEFIKPGTKIDFVGLMKWAVIISFGLIFASFILWFTVGPKVGIDFKGGTEIEILFNQPVPIDKVRSAINGLNLGSAEVKGVGGSGGQNQSYIIRIERKEITTKTEGGETSDISQLITKTLSEKVGSYDQGNLRVSLVGPRAGADLRRKAFLAVCMALVLMLIYIAIRFEAVAATGAALSLVHDVLITMGFLVLTGREFSLTTLAALLTIVGYSINDTIVVYDRIRENSRKRRNLSLVELVNLSINETLSRTILTSSVTMFSVLAILFFTRGSIQDFAFAMTIGIVIGTFSSIFVASAYVIFWRNVAAPKLGLDKKKTSFY